MQRNGLQRHHGLYARQDYLRALETTQITAFGLPDLGFIDLLNRVMTFLVDTTLDGLIDDAAVFVAEPGSSTPFAVFIDGCCEDLIDPPTFSCCASGEPQEVGSLMA